MFFSSRFVFLIVVSCIRCNENPKEFLTRCQFSNVARDQGILPKQTNRPKRFVLFPEFPLWLNDWRYLNHPKEFLFWITNYYPQTIDSKIVTTYIYNIINQINEVIDHRIEFIGNASSISEANFHYQFFNYELCPLNDPLATVKNVQTFESLLIYPKKVVIENRYRAHGGISFDSQSNSSISHTKYNIHHTFLYHNDFQYDPVIYRCNSGEKHCFIDLYSVMLHETLHGFGIEHTETNLPNKEMRAVMHLYASRILCHDDIRAIRMVYGFKVRRTNAKFDDTCRRDFPLHFYQKLMKNFRRFLLHRIFPIGFVFSLLSFVFTLIWIRVRKRISFQRQRRKSFDSSSLQSTNSSKKNVKQSNIPINAFLWHNDYFNQ